MHFNTASQFRNSKKLIIITNNCKIIISFAMLHTNGARDLQKKYFYHFHVITIVLADMLCFTLCSNSQLKGRVIEAIYGKEYHE